MGIVNGTANLAGAQSTFVAMLQDAFNRADGPYLHELACQKVQTSSQYVNQSVVASVPRIEQWIGAKNFRDMRAYTVTETLLTYAKNIEISRMMLETDSTGAVQNALTQLIGNPKADKEDLLVTSFLANAWLGYDGVALLSDSHPHSSSTGDNLTTSALSYPVLKAAKAAMRSFKDEDGTPLNINPTHLIVGPAQETIAYELTGGQMRPTYVNASGAEAVSSVVVASTITNALYGSLQPIVSPWITGNQWALVDLGKPGLKPFFDYVYRDFEAVVQNAMTDESRFMYDKFRFSVEMDRKYAAGAWQCIYGSVSA